MQRKFGVMVGAAALGFAGMLVVGPSAAAAETTHMSSQARGAFYGYEHDDFKGGTAVFGGTYTDLRKKSWEGEPGRSANDNISSMRNQSDREILMYPGVGCTGVPYRAKANSEDKDLTKNNNNPTFDNMASCISFG